jgi:hypothetical protein
VDDLLPALYAVHPHAPARAAAAWLAEAAAALEAYVK